MPSVVAVLHCSSPPPTADGDVHPSNDLHGGRSFQDGCLPGMTGSVFRVRVCCIDVDARVLSVAVFRNGQRIGRKRPYRPTSMPSSANYSARARISGSFGDDGSRDSPDSDLTELPSPTQRANRRKLLVFLGVFVLAGAASLIYTFARPAEYRTSARVQINPGSVQVESIRPIGGTQGTDCAAAVPDRTPGPHQPTRRRSGDQALELGLRRQDLRARFRPRVRPAVLADRPVPPAGPTSSSSRRPAPTPGSSRRWSTR